MEKFSASFLIKNKKIWETFIPYSGANQDVEWSKIVVHMVPTQPFNIDEGRSLLRSEIEIFNPGIQLARDPAWLSNEETRTKKKHGSILIELLDQEVAKKVLEQERIILAGTSCRVHNFIPKYIQCKRCQGYGHTRIHCRGETRCRVCALGHEGKDHSCQICQVANQECPHQPAKCANCGKNHMADDQKCPKWVLVKPRPFRPTTRTTKDSITTPIPMDIE